jgi:F-type H+-transporting ATPase subunit gamma
METLETLHRKIGGVEDLRSVVRSMRAMAASNITQYETAVSSLRSYQRSIALGMAAYFGKTGLSTAEPALSANKKAGRSTCAIVLGSDLGLVGQFNDGLAEHVLNSLGKWPKQTEIWAIGERMEAVLEDMGLRVTRTFHVPNSVNGITALVGDLLHIIQEELENGTVNEFHLFHNRLGENHALPMVESSRFLPLDNRWRDQFTEMNWPTNRIPQIIGDPGDVLRGLVREFLFITLFRSCAESLASENMSRLTAMQRAENNIGDLLTELWAGYYALRQRSIDEELFDVISGFEMLHISHVSNSKRTFK